MKICHVTVRLHDKVNSLHGVILRRYILPGGKIGTNLNFSMYSFEIDGEAEGLQEIKFTGDPGRKGSIVYLDKGIESKYRIGFYGIRPR